ncbi:uncharacterized protein LOC143371206 [Andrena cerasifolii]|uniref:uncharacterized protein LOC143371206 n=1 Tax=Andrena cerasifolii TaxID=2819439 RepID=UPI004037EFF9
MSNERLIELVRVHPVLYDVTDPKYLDSDSKTKIWKQIGAQLNEEGKSHRSYILQKNNMKLYKTINLFQTHTHTRTPYHIFNTTLHSQIQHVRKLNYREALKKKEGKSGQAAKNVKAYKYSAEMSFLIKFFGERSTIGNIGKEPIDNMEQEHNVTDSGRVCPGMP